MSRPEQEQPIALHLKRIEIIYSTFSVKDLPRGKMCEECNGSLVPGITSWYGNLSAGTKVVIVADEVPVLKCQGSCAASWLPPEVILDLLRKATPILRGHRDSTIADILEGETRALSQTIQSEPTHFTGKPISSRTNFSNN